MVDTLLSERHIPALGQFDNGKAVITPEDICKRREELKTVLQEKEYGILPPKPDHLSVSLDRVDDVRFCAGSAELRTLTFTVDLGEDRFSFPAYAGVPKTDKPVPAFVFINFRPDVYDEYLPMEEIMDRGYAVFGFCYKDVTSDDDDFKNGIAKYLLKDRCRKNAPGKIALWAWAAMRVMDYMQTLPEIDTSNIAVIGHSRLGKTALFTGAMDERFHYVISNDSGCGGAALARGKTGETIEKITNKFPYWFCPGLKDYAGKEDEMPFDQNFLAGLIAPRFLCIGSSVEDATADPKSEFLCALAANEAYAWYGKRGLVYDGAADLPAVPSEYSEGDVHYHIRTGVHFLSRRDWLCYMKFIDSKR